MRPHRATLLRSSSFGLRIRKPGLPMPAAEWFEFSSFSPSAGIRSTVRHPVRGSVVKKPDHWHCCLLRGRRERPRGRRGAEQRDEVAPFHSLRLPCFRRKRSHTSVQQETAALRDFNLAYVGCGSKTGCPRNVLGGSASPQRTDINRPDFCGRSVPRRTFPVIDDTIAVGVALLVWT